MQKKFTATLLLAGAALALFPAGLSAETVDGFASSEFIEQANTIQNFLFGPAMRIAGVLGGAYGLMQAILSSSLKPLIIYGGIGLAVNLIPKFIDSVFTVNGMLIP